MVPPVAVVVQDWHSTCADAALLWRSGSAQKVLSTDLEGMCDDWILARLPRMDMALVEPKDMPQTPREIESGSARRIS